MRRGGQQNCYPRDLMPGLVAAELRGRPGQRYLLGGNIIRVLAPPQNHHWRHGSRSTRSPNSLRQPASASSIKGGLMHAASN
jgi:hypothetical protein